MLVDLPRFRKPTMARERVAKQRKQALLCAGTICLFMLCVAAIVALGGR